MHTLLSSDEKVKVVYDPKRGMNLVEFLHGPHQVIDPSTRPLFKDRFAGLGALIGPHFHHRLDEDIPKIKDPHLFPFFEKLLEKGQKEMFSHGIARYVPWTFKGDQTSIEAILKGEDRYKNVFLKELEGFDFELHYRAKLEGDTLHIDYQFEADEPGVIGLHYYYALEELKGRVISNVGPKYHHPEGWKPLETKWLQGPTQLDFKVEPGVEADFGFSPEDPESLGSQIKLVLPSYTLQVDYESDSKENAWQLYHPKDASYVCIEPVTSHNPRKASLKKGHLKVQIKIF